MRIVLKKTRVRTITAMTPSPGKSERNVDLHVLLLEPMSLHNVLFHLACDETKSMSRIAPSTHQVVRELDLHSEHHFGIHEVHLVYLCS